MQYYTNVFRLLLGAFFGLGVMLGIAQAKEVPAFINQAAIATAHPEATEAGRQILQQGGNAFDAAVAITAALAVVEPYGSGLGGGGFWLLYEAETGRSTMLDGRETAPLAATRDMYLDKQGNVVPTRSIAGPLAAGIPGTPAALVHLAETYGKLPLKVSLQSAIGLAQTGFEVNPVYRRMAAFRLQHLQASPEAAQIFLRDGQVPEEGTKILQLDLATTLKALAEHGLEGFYSGIVADKLIEGARQSGGIWTHEDFRQYSIVEREPVQFEWQGMKVTSAALPSSGGIVMAEIFNQLPLVGFESLKVADQVHLLAEAMRRAYRDRAEYMGDVDFVDVPVEILLSKSYAAGLRQSTRLDRATPSNTLAPTMPLAPEGDNTTHFSVIDQWGNRVAATMSINYPFGAAFVPAGTGVLLNDEMDDFSAKPGEPNVYGLVGAEANAIEPGKRMLSSMSPTFLETEERIGLIGTPGGSRIITMVTLAAMAFKEGASAEEMVTFPRFHHQYLPDHIEFEAGFLTAPLKAELEKRGHTLKENSGEWGDMQIVVVNKKNGRASAASDHRGIGFSFVISE